jgi:predicted alpha/beta superfamily hydrolase
MIVKRDILFSPTNTPRTLHIHLPEDYGESQERYPVMYFFDGHNLFFDQDATYGTSWGLEEFLSQWEKTIIIVGIECSHQGRDRLKEYCPYHFQSAYFGDLHGTGEETLRWMVEELKPLIDREYRTYSFREATAIGGSSLGGLMSLYAAIRYNRWFSKAACLSSTVTPCLEEFRRDIARSQLDGDTRVYLSWGTQEAGGSAENLREDFDSYTAHCNTAIAGMLQERGVNTRLYCQPEGRHCEADWEKQVPRFMNYLWLDG